ncbi:hypothetical protein [Faecalimonas sp.]
MKDLPFSAKYCYLALHKRRYVCTCEKRFMKITLFLLSNYNRNRKLILNRYNNLKDNNGAGF